MLGPTSRLAGAAALRWLSTAFTAAASAECEELFLQSWKRVVPHLDPPKLPLSFYRNDRLVPGSIPTKIKFNLFVPYDCDGLPNKEVDMITVPATTGQMGVLPGHTATMTELKPGVLSLHEGNQTTNYFVCGGFAFIHSSSIADIITVEAVPIDRIDPNVVQKGLAEFAQKFASATTDYEKAEAQIGLDVHNALQSALSGSVSEI